MATAIRLIGTGIAMGIVHVLTGPDHMSALATLSSSSSTASKCHVFGLGARWGVGHSTGLLVVGGIFLAIDTTHDGDDDGHHIEIPEAVSRVFESFVGIFMLVLGIYGICEAKNMRNEHNTNSGAGNAIPDMDTGINAYSDRTGDTTDSSEVVIDGRYTDDTFRDGGGIANFEMEDGNSTPECEEFEDEVDDSEEHPYSDESHHHDHRHGHHHSKSPALALCAGIFHGLAGPGGVLGVVPAIQLHHAGLAACYLLSFCVSSTLTMGTFAMTYGSLTAWLTRCGGTESQLNVEFWIRCISASLSLLVGVLWLVLLAMGKLEDVFG